MKKTSHSKGIWGEELAVDYMKTHGAEILFRRWRSPYGELDIVAKHENYLLFVEVKLRKNAKFGEARAFVTEEKQEKIKLTAELFLLENDFDLQPRFDVVEIYAPMGENTKKPAVIYWEDAFQ